MSSLLHNSDDWRFAVSVVAGTYKYSLAFEDDAHIHIEGATLKDELIRHVDPYLNQLDDRIC